MLAAHELTRDDVDLLALLREVSASVLGQAAFALWERDANLLPAEVVAIRTYVNSL